MRLIDTHLHLYDEAFDADREEVVERMRQAGVVKCIMPAIDKDSFGRQSSVSSAYRYGAITGHPSSLKNI